MKPLPKRMLPSRLSLLKSVLRVFRPAGLQPALAGSGASRFSPSSQDYQPSKDYQPQQPQPTFEPPQTSAFLDDSSLSSATATPAAPGQSIRIAGPQIGPSGSILIEPQDPEQGIWSFIEEDVPKPVPQIYPEQEVPEKITDPEAPMTFTPGAHPEQDVTAFVGDKATVPEPKPLNKARQEQGLKPGELDPNSMAKKIAQRGKELRERRMYLKNFWYAAGKAVLLRFPDMT